jgi:hypothetical protein
VSCFVVLSEAKNLASVFVYEKKPPEILRFAQHDNVLSFSAACQNENRAERGANGRFRAGWHVVAAGLAVR